MQYHNNILVITVPELVQCGIPQKTIYRGIDRQRTGEQFCWAHTKVGKAVYVHYDTLKNEYKERIKAMLCGGVEPAEYLANQAARAKADKLTATLKSLGDLLEIAPATLTKLTDSGLLTAENAQRIARAEAWLRLNRKIDVKAARSMGFCTIVEVQNELFAQYLTEQKNGWVLTPKPIGNIQVFNRLARRWEKEGISVLLHKGFGNQNKTKVNKVTHAKLIELAALPIKLSFEDIGLQYNGFAEQNGLPLMTVSAIKEYLNRPAVYRIWYYLRHGKHEGNRVLRQQITRNAPSRPDALWSVDGTTMQLYYRNEAGKMCSDLYAVFVTDAHSGAIIGKSVGFVESSGLVIDALRDAIMTHGYKPYQLQYDNGSANVSRVVKGLMANMTRVSFPCRPHAAAGKYVEGIIGHFQQRVLRKFEEFKGGNVDTASPNSWANPELLAYLSKNTDQLHTQAGIIEAFGAAVDEWNTRGEKRDKYGNFTGKSKIARYKALHAKRTCLTEMEKLSLFAVEVPNNKHKHGMYEYRQRGIEITVNGAKCNYVVPDDGMSTNDFVFANENLYKAFRVRMNVAVDKPSFITLYDKAGKFIAEAYEKERYAGCIADMRDGDMQKIKRFIAQADAAGYAHALAEMEAQRAVLAEAGFFAATGTDGYGFGWQDTPKILENKRQGALEDVRNGLKIATPAPVSEPKTPATIEIEKRLQRIGS